MFEKFGEFDSCEEINRAAKAQLEEGDLEAIRTITEENGLDPEDAEDFCTGAIEELTTPILAAIGKLELEAKDLKLEGALKDWTDSIKQSCMENEEMALAVRRKGKSLKDCMALVLKTAFNAKTQLDAYNAAVDLFGSKAGPALAEFCKDGKLNFEELGASLNDNLGNVDDTFNATLDPADQFKVTLNELKDAGYDVGNALGPVLAECLQTVTPILKDLIGSWNSLSPETQEMIIKCALLVAALGPVFSIISKVSGGISSVIDIGAKIAPVISGASETFTAFNAVLAANPVLLVVAAVIALIAIFVVLYNKCEWFRDGVNSVFCGIRDFIKGVIDKIKDFMNFEWKLPKIKLPHFKASGEWSLIPPKVPKFSVDWYANGGILNSPTIFGMNGNTALGGGEAGKEAVLPIDLLKTYIRDEMQANNYALAQLIAEALSEMSLVIENQIQLGDKKLADVLVDAIIKKMSQNIKWKKGAAGV